MFYITKEITKMNKYFLAIDIGASSGRHILGWIEDGVLKTEEVYRFENNLVKQGGVIYMGYR